MIYFSSLSKKINPAIKESRLLTFQFASSPAMSSYYHRRIPNPQPLTFSDQNLRRWAHRRCLISSPPPSQLNAIAISYDLRLHRNHAIEPIEFRIKRSKTKESAICCLSALGERIEEKAAAAERRKAVEVAAAAAVTVVLGTGNRVLYKLALVPLKKYPFFLAQLATFGYVVVYFSILYCRYQAGIVTDEMLSLPKAPFLVVGLLEALGAASGMAAGAVLSGASIPILSQTFLVWQLFLSAIFLGRRYRPNQILGCLLVAVGVIITVASGSDAGLSLQNAGLFWTLLMVISFLFQAADTVLKEIIFLNARKQLKGGSVDLFVVNSFGSAFQALFICLLLPLLSKLWGVPFRQLPTYIKDGAGCLLNLGSLSSGCEGAPVLPLLFVVVNMAFNISLLYLLKVSSAVVSCLASTFSVPLAIYAFTIPLPYIGVASPLPSGFVAGTAVLLGGLLLYCLSSPPTQTIIEQSQQAQG